MEDYRPVMFDLSCLLALWSVAYISAPMQPESFTEYALLALASLWLLFAMVHVQKFRRRMTSLFFGACALIPWAFYAELMYIRANSDGIDPEVFTANLKHALFIYQSFKYLFLACAAGAALKALFISVKNFGSTDRI